MKLKEEIKLWVRRLVYFFERELFSSNHDIPQRKMDEARLAENPFYCRHLESILCTVLPHLSVDTRAYNLNVGMLVIYVRYLVTTNQD